MPSVNELWKVYKPVSQRHDSGNTDTGRAAHLIRHLGAVEAERLTLLDVDGYRAARLAETTHRGGPPAPATLDREVELLRRLLGYALAGGLLARNPLAGRALFLRPCNVRETVLDEKGFQVLMAAAAPRLRPALLVAFDTGMRLGEIAALRWAWLTPEGDAIRIPAAATKTERSRVIYLTARVRKALAGVKRSGERVFPMNIPGAFKQARKAAGMPHVWFHDLRRSFVTNARRKGVPESVVMRFSGHRTRSVFDRYNVIDEGDLRRAAAIL